MERGREGRDRRTAASPCASPVCGEASRDGEIEIRRPDSSFPSVRVAVFLGNLVFILSRRVCVCRNRTTVGRAA